MTNNASLSSKAKGRERMNTKTFSISLATGREREEIYRVRHEVYARELGQHPVNPAARLRDSLDDGNVFLIARIAGELAGFISITPPSLGSYSIDKYFARETLPFPADEALYEIRLLTVVKTHRGRELAMLLMYGAFRWVESHGGQQLVAIGRREILDLYLRVGLRSLGKSTRSGLVTYDLLHATVADIRATLPQFKGLFARLEQKTRWELSFGFIKPATCFHGGDFFSAIGPRFDALARKEAIINADVLDAWFPPSPRVTAILKEHLNWLVKTSPPTGCEGLIDAIAEARGVNPTNILPGAGSSDLIFRALRQWFSRGSRALILDPTYGEYAHVLDQVIGCTVDRLPLCLESYYDLDLDRLRNAFADDYDLVVIVNPNSPTGRHIPRVALEGVLRGAPARTRVWVDETYVDYAGGEQSLESFAARTENVIVCKSMSKAYALSGLRVAYLCAGAHQLEALRAITPPWVVGLPAQLAATLALQDPDYYAERYSETHRLREELAKQLHALGWEIFPGVANFLLCHLPESGPSAERLVRECRVLGLFLRDASLMGSRLGGRTIRIAVKDATTNQRMVGIIASVRSL